MPTIYQVPRTYIQGHNHQRIDYSLTVADLLHEQGLVPLLLSKLDLPSPQNSLAAAKGAEKWESWINLTLAKHQADLKIALVGKYVRNLDAYMSVVKAVCKSHLLYQYEKTLSY